MRDECSDDCNKCLLMALTGVCPRENKTPMAMYVRSWVKVGHPVVCDTPLMILVHPDDVKRTIEKYQGDFCFINEIHSGDYSRFS